MDILEASGGGAVERLLHGRSDSLSHAYIIYGGDGGAAALAAAMVCGSGGQRPCGQCAHCKKAAAGAHPDIIYVDKPDDKKEMPVKTIRETVRDTVVLPNEAEMKVYVFRDAGGIRADGQNALLKALEEPPPHVSFILVADAPEDLLATVRSRCVELTAGAERGEAGVSDEAKKAARDFFGALDAGALPFVTFAFALEKLDRTVFTEFVAAARELAAAGLRDCAGGKPERVRDMRRALDALNTAQDHLQLNVNAGHITGMLCAELMPAAPEAQRKEWAYR
ncbi:MAG: hypothetical protein LBJ99_00425 [Oscillospiraceae bacterium]|jgi:hypothetical protein|nr:hypothetical protein [Oscillospiraceae bacterium]